MKTFKEFWSDPVWSKVISAGIIAVLGALIIGCYSLITTKSFFDLLLEFLMLKIALWIVLLFALFTGALYLTFRSKPSVSVNPTPHRIRVLVDLTNASEFNIETQEAKMWDNDKEVGERAIGRLEIKEGGVLDLKRRNTDGRFIIRILDYHNGDGVDRYVKSNVHLETDRRLLVSFRGKVIGGMHTIRVICTKKNSPYWVHNAFFNFVIDSKEYQEFKQVLKVPASEEFNIRMEDIDVEKQQSSVQIRDFVVTELY